MIMQGRFLIVATPTTLRSIAIVAIVTVSVYHSSSQTIFNHFNGNIAES